VIVVDRATRYTWLFLTRTKIPPVEPLRGFLRTHGTKQSVLKWVRTDEGGELWGSHAYQKMLMEEGFIPEPTASDASFQNGVAERPNCTLADMMRSLLHCAQLGPEYWSWAILHATYLKNRLPHHAIHKTPYEAYTGNRPNLKHLRIFGSPITARNPGRRPAKLDIHASHGIFLGYTATHRNVYYLDSNTKKVKISMHVIFDEAGYTLPPSHRTILQQHLHLQGSNSMCNTKDQPLQNNLQSIIEESADGSTQGALEGSTQGTQVGSMSGTLAVSKHDTQVGLPHGTLVGSSPIHIPATTNADDADRLYVTKLSSHAVIPTRPTSESAGYDLHSAHEVALPPHATMKVPTDLTVRPPAHTYCQILFRSSLVLKHGVEVKAGTIDRDYMGNLIVLLRNMSDTPYIVQRGDRIAQLVIYTIAHPPMHECQTLPTTNQGSGGFGSTGYNSDQIKTLCDTTQDMVPIKPPYNIWLSEHPFQKILNVQLETTVCHPTMGMVFNTTLHKDRIQLSDMVKSTPGAKLPRWRSTLKRAILLKVGNKHITNEEQVHQTVQDARQQQLPTIPLVFATVQYHGIHPMEGSLMLYYDQLNVIRQHLRAAYPQQKAYVS
jgi:dUTP pyrophosphatase